jgi:hypothetical protein
VATALLLGRGGVTRVAAILLVLFPVLFIYDTRLGAAALALAVVCVYRKASTSARRRAIDRRFTPVISPRRGPS